MKKNLLLTAIVGAVVSLTACNPLTINVNVPENNGTQVTSDDNVTKSDNDEITKADDSEGGNAGEADSEVKTVEVSADNAGEYADLVSFVSQFENYAALAYNYDEYRFTEFDDCAKCKIIALTESYQEDSEFEMDSEWELCKISKERALVLSKRFFNTEVNTYAAQDINTNHEDVVKSNDDGDLLFSLGDWGTRYPMPLKYVVTDNNDGTYAVEITLIMHDAMENTDSDPIGTFTVNISEREDGTFYITDFKL